MRRGTPSAELFGGLLTTLRLVGTESSMRRTGEKIGVPAATVSQIEKGQRALKVPKIATWADALEVDEDDLHELWLLSQGQVRIDQRLVFYRDHPEALGSEPLGDRIDQLLKRHPDLEPIYRLADRIAFVLRRALPPSAHPRVEPDASEPPYPEEETRGTATEAERVAQDEWKTTVDLPMIYCHRVGVSERDRWSEYVEGERVRVPQVEKLAPIVRRRGRSVKAVELDELVRELSGPERERVRGYVEAILEQRTAPMD